MRHIFSMLVVLAFSLSSVVAQSDCDDTNMKAFLGVQSEGLSSAKAKVLGFENEHGNYVTRVLGNTAAEQANLQAFDYIVGIDNYELSEDRGLTRILKNYKVGDQATVHYIRNGQKQSTSITFGKHGDADRSYRDREEDPFLGINRHQNNNAREMGVRVNIIDNSTAETLGLKDGDKIMSINNNPIVDWSDITTAIDNLSVGEDIAVEFERGLFVYPFCQQHRVAPFVDDHRKSTKSLPRNKFQGLPQMR